MNLPPLFPDELGQGYFSRVATLNGIGDPLFEHSRLLDRLGPWGTHTDPKSWAECIESLTQIPAVDFVRRHTLIPFFCSIQPNEGGHWDDVSAERSRLLLRFRPALRGSWKYCADCAKEDLRFWGVSYWRRSHQLPGCVWCTKHETGLHTAADPNAHRHLPHTLTGGEQVNPKVVANALGNKTIRRYAEICSAFLESNYYHALYDVVHALNVRCRELKLNCELEWRTKAPWAPLIPERLSGCWFDEVAAKAPRTNRIAAYGPGLLTSLRSVHCIGQYSFVLALLFESAETAMLSLSRAIGSLEEKYVAEARCSLFGGLATSGETSRSTSKSAKRALELFVEGSSIGDSCRAAGADIFAVEHELRLLTARVLH